MQGELLECQLRTTLMTLRERIRQEELRLLIEFKNDKFFKNYFNIVIYCIFFIYSSKLGILFIFNVKSE